MLICSGSLPRYQGLPVHQTDRMKNAPIPLEEESRLAALRSYGVLDSGPEPAFDRLTRLGAAVFGTPIVLVTLVDQNIQWFKSCYGLAKREITRGDCFCAHALSSDNPLIVPDARRSPVCRLQPLLV